MSFKEQIEFLELKKENKFLHKHLKVWKDLYTKCVDENDRLAQKVQEFSIELKRLKDGTKG